MPTYDNQQLCNESPTGPADSTTEASWPSWLRDFKAAVLDWAAQEHNCHGIHQNVTLFAPVTRTEATVNLTTTDAGFLQLLNTSANAMTVTLPAASTIAQGRYFTFKLVDNTNTLTILPTGSDTIDGCTTFTIPAQWSVLLVASNGVDGYYVIDASLGGTNAGGNGGGSGGGGQTPVGIGLLGVVKTDFAVQAGSAGFLDITGLGNFTMVDTAMYLVEFDLSFAFGAGPGSNTHIQLQQGSSTAGAINCVGYGDSVHPSNPVDLEDCYYSFRAGLLTPYPVSAYKGTSWFQLLRLQGNGIFVAGGTTPFSIQAKGGGSAPHGYIYAGSWVKVTRVVE